ncbi:MAG: hypothetical protein IJ637_02575 [Prevotella sp.]|nr:hypothetical protein [Prevotella sp.]
MRKLFLSAAMAMAFLCGANAETIVTNDNAAASLGVDNVNATTGADDDSESFGYGGLLYYGFDDFENYGLTFGMLNPNGFGLDIALRAQFKDHGNFNGDFLFNYSFALMSKNSNQVLLTLALGPSMRTYDEVKGFDSRGNIEWNRNKTAFDGVINPRLTIKLGRVVLMGGYFYWAPKFKFNKDDGATGGYNVGLGISF